MNATQLPNESEMYRALCEKDSNYDGIFFVGVKTTGIFCRPICPAKKPKRENVLFFANARDALSAGFRSCRKCHPLESAAQMPNWLESAITLVEDDPAKKWTDQELKNEGIEPSRIRRWFKAYHGITFHGYLRARRLSAALAKLSLGMDPIAVAHDSGYESVSGFREAFQKWFGTTPGRPSNAKKTLTVNRIPTLLGPMVAAADNDGLFLLEFADRRMLETQFQRLSQRLTCQFSPGDNEILEQTATEIGQYFSGQRQSFDVPIVCPGTDFQKQIWNALTQIPFGQTTSYAQLGQNVGRPNAQRAVGRANGDNRLAIIVPCHRVVKSDGTLCGYAGGLRRKEWLLQHEARHSDWVFVNSSSAGVM